MIDGKDSNKLQNAMTQCLNEKFQVALEYC